MSVFTDPSQFYTRKQSDSRYQMSPQAPTPPTNFVLASKPSGTTWLQDAETAYLIVTLVDPVTPTWASTSQTFVSGYLFTATYTSGLGVAVNVTSTLPYAGPNGTYQVPNLPTGVQVSLTAKTVDYLGASGPASTAIVVTTDVNTTPPAVPSVTSVLSYPGIAFTIQNPDTAKNFDYYELWRGQEILNSPNVTWTVPPLFRFIGNQAVDLSIPATGAYFYKVRAYDTAGNYADSVILGSFTLTGNQAAAPVQPSLTSATATANADGSIDLSFPVTLVSTVTSYRIYRKDTVHTSWLLLNTTAQPSASPITYHDTNVINGVAYTYSLSAVASFGGESSFSQTGITATSNDTTTPAAIDPTTVVFTGQLGSLNVSWPASTDATLNYYTVTVSIDGINWLAAERAPTNNYTIYGLTETKDQLANVLKVAITVVDQNGNSSAATTCTVTYPSLITFHPASTSLPPSPFTVSGVSNPDGSITLSWPAPSIPDVAGYLIEELESGSLWESLTTVYDSTAGTKSYTAIGLTPFNFGGVLYRYRVHTIDTSGNISTANLIENPSFSQGITTWIGTYTLVSPGYNNLGYSARVSYASPVSQSLAVTAGLAYTASAYIGKDTVSANATVAIHWYNSSGVQISSSTGTLTTVTTGYQRVSVTATAPATATTASVILLADSTQPAVTVLFDDIQFEQSAFLSPYGDGKTLFISSVDTNGPGDYAPTITITPGIGSLSLLWNNPTTSFVPNEPTNNGYLDYVGGAVYEIWRSPDSTTWSKVAEVPANASSTVTTANYTDLSPSDTLAAHYYYKIRARDRFGNEGSWLNSTQVVNSTSLTLDSQVGATASVLAAANAASTAQSQATAAATTANSKATITVATVAPSSPNKGDIWYNTSVSPAAAMVWSATVWAAADAAAQGQAAAASTAATTASSLAGTKAKVTIATTAPSSPSVGDIWINTTATPQVVETWTGSLWKIAADVTSQNTAAGIVGQGTLATSNTANLDTQVTDGTTYVRPKYINSDGTIHVSTLLNAQGNIITYQPINYSTSWTKTTASVSILAQTLLRGDGSSITVNTSSISYTGLAPGTTYYLYPYINIATGNLAAANGNPPPTIQNGTMATQACGDGFLSLGPVFITTMTTIGSGGNTGGGGCPESEELVDVEGRGQIKAGAIVVGDCIRGKSLATDKDVYRKVIQMRQETCHAWRVIDGHKNSPCESVYHEGQWLPAFRVEGAIVNQDAGIKTILVVEADSYGEHNFYLTAGTPLLIHNGASES